MITIKTFVFNDLQENTYLLYDETCECVIVDAGNYYENETQEIATFIETHKLKPVHLLNTHCHIDHILGNKYFAENFGLKLKAHEGEVPLLRQAPNYAELFGFSMKTTPLVSDFLKHDDEIQFGNSLLKIIHVPGHSPGGICFYSAINNFVLTGDVLFYGSIGRSDLPGGNYDELIDSLKSKLLVLPENTTVYSGHGTTTTVGFEKMYNPFLV